jgi:hypothetical protein
MFLRTKLNIDASQTHVLESGEGKLGYVLETQEIFC